MAETLRIEDYSDDQIRQELTDFFNWKPKHVLKLTKQELLAWKKHAIALRLANFWWVNDKVTRAEFLQDDTRARHD